MTSHLIPTAIVIACILTIAACGGNRPQVIVVQEAQAVDRIRAAARAALISAATLSAATQAASQAHNTAVSARNTAFLSGAAGSASRAESVAATSVRAVVVTMGETAARADALAAAGVDAPQRFDLTLPLSVVSRFSNTIAERQDTLSSQVNTFSLATQDVHDRTAAVSSAVRQINTTTDALSAADTISTARGRLDDAMAEVVTADVLLTSILSTIRLDAEQLEDAARTVEQTLPGLSTPRRDLERDNR